jgi:hypothetical protein
MDDGRYDRDEPTRKEQIQDIERNMAQLRTTHELKQMGYPVQVPPNISDSLVTLALRLKELKEDEEKEADEWYRDRGL